jgi:hypothetical protein
VTQRIITRTPENMGKLRGWRDAQTAMLPFLLDKVRLGGRADRVPGHEWPLEHQMAAHGLPQGCMSILRS